MATRKGKKLIKNVAKTMGRAAAKDNAFTPNDLSGVFKKGTDMGVSRRGMGRALVKGVKQGNKERMKGSK